MRVFAVISADKAAQLVQKYMDSHDFDKARDLSYLLESFISNLKQTLSDKGGHLHVVAGSRIVADLPEEDADCLVPYIHEIKKAVGVPVSSGFGRSMAEAMSALNRSNQSGELEVYGEYDEKRKETDDKLSNAPVDTFDPTVPQQAKKEPATSTVPSRPSLEESAAQSESLAQLVLGGQQSVPPSAPPVDPSQPPQGAPQAPAQDQAQAPQSSSPDMSSVMQRRTNLPKKAESPMSPNEPKKDQPHEKIGRALSLLRAHMPAILGMADRNPKAFGQAMGLLSKLTAMSKSLGVQYPESITQRLQKAANLNRTLIRSLCIILIATFVIVFRCDLA